MRKALLYPLLTLMGYAVVLWVAVFLVAPSHLPVADFLARANIAIPRPDGWNLALIENTGTPPLTLTLTSVLTIVSYGAVLYAAAMYLGERVDTSQAWFVMHDDLHAQHAASMTMMNESAQYIGGGPAAVAPIHDPNQVPGFPQTGHPGPGQSPG